VNRPPPSPDDRADASATLIEALASAYGTSPRDDPLEVLQRNLAPEFAFEGWVGDVALTGAERFRRDVFEPYSNSYRDCHYDIDAVVTDGRLLVVSGTFYGSKTKLSGEQVELEWKFRDLYEVEGGQVTRFSVASDTLAVDRLLGGEPA
jgi:hypothetical protein